MDYKKFFILLLVLANIFLVIGLLVNKEITIPRENFQATVSPLAVAASNTQAATAAPEPNPYNFPPGRCLSQDIEEVEEDTEMYSGNIDGSFICKFHILFIVNNPDGCPNDADIKTYYETYFGESEGKNRQTKFTIPDLYFDIYDLRVIDRILDYGLKVSDEILALQARQASPFIIYKNKNSHTFLLHRAPDQSLRLETNVIFFILGILPIILLKLSS